MNIFIPIKIFDESYIFILNGQNAMFTFKLLIRVNDISVEPSGSLILILSE